MGNLRILKIHNYYISSISIQIESSVKSMYDLKGNVFVKYMNFQNISFIDILNVSVTGCIYPLSIIVRNIDTRVEYFRFDKT